MPRVRESAGSLVHLAGMPASGKSHFGRWVHEHHGFVHLDVEKAGQLASLGLEAAWNRCFEQGDVTTFLGSLRTLNTPVLINWGFPVACLPIVDAFKQSGVELWWFDAEYDQARREFLKRADVPLSAFEAQFAAISRERVAIETLFRPNVITTLDGDGRRPRPSELFDRIFARHP